jgi:hypothetical protein
MTLTPSDVASIAFWSRVWEFCEYASEAVVGLGCLGEYIAEYTQWRTEQWRHTLGRRSLVFLIVGIGAGIVALIETNTLAGRAMESVGQQAEEASRRASSASRTANDAVSKSNLAEAASGRAIDKSEKATASASGAIVLARGARLEADTFEKDIKTARKEAADALANLAQAKRLAEEAQKGTAQLTDRFADRSLSDTQVRAIGDALSPFSSQEWEVTPYWDISECINISNRILAALQAARWKYIPPEAFRALMGGVVGVLVYVHPSPPGNTVRPAADALVAALNANGIAAQLKLQNPKDPATDRISLNVGTKN